MTTVVVTIEERAMGKGTYYYIYQITNNVNGKVYIGKRTSVLPPERDVDYMGSGKLIKRAINKYGIENFSKTILEICKQVDLNEREKYYISQINSRDMQVGYNITPGGDGVGEICANMKTYYNKETDSEIRVKDGEPVPDGYVHGRRPFTEEHIKKTANKGEANGMFGVHRFGEQNPFYGKKHKPEFIELLRNRRHIINCETGERRIVDIRNGIPEGFITVQEWHQMEKEKRKRERNFLREKAITEKLKKEKPKKPEVKNDAPNEFSNRNNEHLHMHIPEEREKLIKLWSEIRIKSWEGRGNQICPYCGKTGRGAGFFHWHMDNCINHPIYGETNKERKEKYFKEHGKKLKGKRGTTNNKVCITDGVHNKFVNPEDIANYPDFRVDVTLPL